MRKFGFLIFLFFLIYVRSFAQELTASQKLRNARAIYDQGRLHELPTSLEEALLVKTGSGAFSKTEKVEALQILILTYIYLEEPKKADDKMTQLLDENHFFELSGSEPVEFQNLYLKFRKDPIFKVGLKFGANQSFINTLKNYYIVGEGKGVYIPKTALQVGISFEKVLKGKFSGAPELFFLSNNSFSYKNADPYTVDPNVSGASKSALLRQTITHKKIQLNALLKYTIGSDKSLNRKITPFITLGPTVSYLTKSTFKGETTLEDKNQLNGTLVNTDQYRKLIFSVLAGGGATFKIGEIFIVAEARFQYGFKNVVNGNNRYKDTPAVVRIKNQYSYIDNDFSMHVASINLGIVYPIFIPKKLIK
jgi:hypothetical protein